MRCLPVKLKIALWFALLMLLLSALLLSLLIGIGRRVVSNATQDELMATVEQSRADIEYEYGVLDFDDDLKFFDNGVSLSVFDEEKRLLYGRSPAGFDQETAFESGIVRQTSDFYVYDMHYQQEGYGAIWVRGVLSTENSNAAFAILLQVAVVLLPLLVILSAAGAYFLTHKALRPVQKITETALQISRDGDLERRIPTTAEKDEIGKLAAAFNAMFDSLQAAFEKERQFTSDASHELRTPAGVILMECEEALAQTQSPAQARQTLGHIHKQSLRTSRLISQLLDIARADQNKAHTETETLDLADIAHNVLEQAAKTALLKNITISEDIPGQCLVEGDETMLTRLLWNLMENAVKYNEENGAIRLSLRADGHEVRCVIEDTGLGIAPSQLPKIWDRFWRAEESRSTEGSGLGLSLCKQIVQAHGGAITAESVLGEGSKFIFTLPRK
jgi:signal transduction histidine kinase